jgi:hypothetical protein
LQKKRVFQQAVRQSPLGSSHAQRPPRGRLRSSRVTGQ